LIELARRSGQIADISAHVVYADDLLELEFGADPKLIHVPNFNSDRTDDRIVGAYMVARLKDTTMPHIEFVPRADIDKIRSASKGAWTKDGKPIGPWRDHFAEMCRKTAVRRGVKYLPVSIELAEAIQHDDAGFERTQVFSASTGQPESRTESVLSKITSRPISENQTFEPAPEAVAQAEGVDAETGEVMPNAEPAAIPDPKPMLSHADLVAAMGGVASAANVPESVLHEWLKSATTGVKIDKVSPADRLAILKKFATEVAGLNG
jgi:recombinational DNA repair protein RecT